MSSGGEMTATIYWLVAPLGGAAPIPGGDYRAHLPAKPFIIADPIRGGFPWLCSPQS